MLWVSQFGRHASSLSGNRGLLRCSASRATGLLQKDTGKYLTPAQLCGWLQVDVPEGYRPFCSGGVSTAADDGSFTVGHGNTILVWVDTVEPRLALSPSTTTTTVMTEDHDDEDDAAQPRRPPQPLC